MVSNMNYNYYIVNRSSMQIIDVKPDFVEAYNEAEKLGRPTAIFQGCFLTELAAPQPDTDDNDESNESD